VVVRIAADLTLSKPYADQEPDSLVDGTAKVLEREGIDEGVVCCRRIRFWARLRGRARSGMSVIGGGKVVPYALGPVARFTTRSGRCRLRNQTDNALLSNEDLDQ